MSGTETAGMGLQAFEYIQSYAPYEQIEAKDYPHVIPRTRDPLPTPLYPRLRTYPPIPKTPTLPTPN
eukprot:443141-Rhodomonas_salina.1